MEKRLGRALCWVRRDLRLHDHGALSAATMAAEEVAVAFVFDTNILRDLPDRDDRRVTFIHQSLVELDQRLRERGSGLIVRIGDPTEIIPALASDLGAEAVYTARDYEPYARARDEKVAERLQAAGRHLVAIKDTVIFEPEEVVAETGPYRVYTPFMRRWRSHFVLERDAAEKVVDHRRLMPGAADYSEPWSLLDIGFAGADLWTEPGETAARKRAHHFMHAIDEYHNDRDFPSRGGTSGLSVHLRFGTVSIRELVRLATAVGGEGVDKWVNELIWREFYQAVLYHFPQVVTEPFQPQYRDIAYPGREEHWERWCQGQTGYPIVDAAMRCFNATGYMHNRLRMVVASFLTKDLLLDYRRGEECFARYLLDFDLASNNGGWQWAASVGADPQPYFRIFNPYLQSAKFDPDGTFIRQWVPELRDLEAPAIHDPSRLGAVELLAAGIQLDETYPRPIVDHHVQKALAVQLLEGYRASKP